MKNEDERPREELSSDRAADRAFENYWYHYKWHTIAGIFIAVVLIILISQMVGKKQYDAHVLYTGPLYLDGEVCADIAESIAKVSAELGGESNPAEYTGDGVLTVDINKIVYVPDETAQTYRENSIYFNGEDNKTNRGDFDNAIVIGEYVILLIDRSLYESTVSAGVFLPWEDTVGYTPENAIDNYGILLSDLPLGSLNGFRQLPKDTVLCCRAKSYVNRFNSKVQNSEMYAAQVSLFSQLISYRTDDTEGTVRTDSAE